MSLNANALVAAISYLLVGEYYYETTEMNTLISILVILSQCP